MTSKICGAYLKGKIKKISEFKLEKKGKSKVYC